MPKMEAVSIPFAIILITFFPATSVLSADTLRQTQSLTNDQTLVSPAQAFELGFFNPGTSDKWFLGIWYKRIAQRTFVWVANRDAPLADSSGVLRIGDRGNVVLLDRFGTLAWSSNETKAANPVLQLLDTGNLVLKEAGDESSDNYLWQSFDYPTDTLLPDMKLGWDFRRNLERHLTSWKNNNDPSSGDYSFKLDFHGFPEVFLRNKEERIYRSGPWVGNRFSGVPEMEPTNDIDFFFVSNEQEVYYSFHIKKKSLISRLVVNSSGTLQRYTWIEDRQTWSLFWFASKDQCDNYLECGAYGICDTNASPVCKCAAGFKPKNPQAWVLRDGSDGCVRQTGLNCGSDGFLRLTGMKLPESGGSFVDEKMKLEDCREACLKNCSCSAYANSNATDGGSGCVMWSGDLLDMREYAEGGQDLFVRLSASDLASAGLTGKQSNKRKQVVEIASIAFGIAILLSGVIIWFAWKTKGFKCLSKRKIEQKGIHERSQDFLLNEVVISSKRDYSGEHKTDEFELPLFDYNTIATGTCYFSDENKLGQGGFGCVYKGELIEGQQIAVKRLSRNSGQGIEEFKNEVRLIARLQHRNLVRLLGCCIEKDEKILIYEYMENRSLDSVLFNKSRSSLLDWQRRFNIICGIARGLLYLHQDSRFRIIHRDLKASNILLDGDMNPKISDFGMARIFGGDQSEASSTRRVVGTYGYMSPEYAMDGLFSVKSDVFSFGVLVLEAVSGKKNRGFYHSNSELNLLGHAWGLWKDGKGIELLDSSAGDSYPIQEVLRCIQIGLLCVQERAEDRPTMSTVVLMLGSESAAMPQPKQPGFCLSRNPIETDSSSSKQDETFSVNQVTVTMLDAR